MRDQVVEEYRRTVAVLKEAGDLDPDGCYRRGRFQGHPPVVAALYHAAEDGEEDDQAVNADGTMAGFRLSVDEQAAFRCKPYVILRIVLPDDRVELMQFDSPVAYQHTLDLASDPEEAERAAALDELMVFG